MGDVTLPINSGKGDIAVGDGTGGVSTVSPGSNGLVLVADSGSTAGVKWAPVSAEGLSDAAIGGLVADGTSQTRAALMTLFDAVPTLSQTAYALPLTGISETTDLPIFAALYPCESEQIALLCGGDIAQSATDYWTITIYRVRNGLSVPVASKSTASKAIQRTAVWDYDLVEIGRYATLAVGDVLVARFKKTGTPPPVVTPLLMFRAPATSMPSPADTLVARDSFTRADSASTLGSPDDGPAWTAPHGTWGINTNSAYLAATGAGAAHAVIDAQTSDVAVQVKMSVLAAGTAPGIVLRYADQDNLIAVTPTGIVRRSAGSDTTVGSIAYAQGDTIRVHMEGPTVTYYRDTGSTGLTDPVSTFTISGEALIGNTKHGLRHGVGTDTTRFDDFKMWSI